MPKSRCFSKLRKLTVWPELRHVIGGPDSLAAQFAACHVGHSSTVRTYAIYAIRDPRFVDPFGHRFGPAFYVGLTSRPRSRVIAHLGRAVHKKRPDFVKDRQLMAILNAGEVPQFELLSCVFGLSPALRAEQLWTRYFATMGYTLTFGITNPAFVAPEYAHAFEPDYSAEAMTVGEAHGAGQSIHLQCLSCGEILEKRSMNHPRKHNLAQQSLGQLRAEQRHCFECSGQAFCLGVT